MHVAWGRAVRIRMHVLFIVPFRKPTVPPELGSYYARIVPWKTGENSEFGLSFFASLARELLSDADFGTSFACARQSYVCVPHITLGWLLLIQ